jgi:hypothetical protein
VYALLSIIAVQGNLRIESNYAKNLQEFYQDLFIKSVEHLKDLRLLQSCELLKSTHGMPTLVTDWSVPRSTIRLKFGRADGDTLADVCFPREGILRVKGLQVATIHQIDVVRLQDDSAQEDVAEELQRLASHFNLKADASRRSAVQSARTVSRRTSIHQ